MVKSQTPNLPSDQSVMSLMQVIRLSGNHQFRRRIVQMRGLGRTVATRAHTRMPRLNWRILLVCLAGPALLRATPAEPLLRLVAKIPVPGMTGTWDHIGADGAGGRLFGNAQDISTLEVIDLHHDRVTHTITGPFNRNQGVAWLPHLQKLVISNGHSGLCVFLDGRTLKPEKSVGIGLGADLMAYDPAAQLLYVDHGGRDSNRGFGAVAVIDAAREALIADIPTDLRPAAMAIQTHGPYLYVCIPSANQVAVINRSKRRIVRRFGLGSAKKPVSLALDESDQRLFIGARNPARLLVLDSNTGRLLASLPTAGEVEDVCYDPRHHRIYVSGLDGVIHVYRQLDADHYALAARIPTRPHAATSVWIPAMNRYCLAVSQHGAEMPAIWVFAPQP